jgi:hypothetical protein
MLNFEYPEAVMVETGSLKLFQNRLEPVQGKCCLKNVEIFCLTLFWYSPTYRYFSISENVLIYLDICNFSVAATTSNLSPIDKDSAINGSVFFLVSFHQKV